MTESNFPFVKNQILRQNLDEAFDHIVILLQFTESVTYNEVAKSAFRKTIIIYTASIVEALLFHVLDNKFSDDDIKGYYGGWEVENKKVLYEIDDSHHIIAGDYKKVLGKAGKEKMNLGQITDFLKKKEVISKNLFEAVDELRVLRNEQHIGTHVQVKSYTKDNLEKAFFVAREVKEFIQKQVAEK